MEKYECPCGYIYDPEAGDPLPPAPNGKIFPMIGFAPCAALAKTPLAPPDGDEPALPALFFSAGLFILVQYAAKTGQKM